MDTKNATRTAGDFLLTRTPGTRIVAGAKQLRKALLSGKTQKVFLAQSADPAITEPIAAMCQQNYVEYAWVPSMTDLGRACGIDVGAAAAAVVTE